MISRWIERAAQKAVHPKPLSVCLDADCAAFSGLKDADAIARKACKDGRRGMAVPVFLGAGDQRIAGPK